MESAPQNILTLIIVIQFIFGNLSNGFMVLVNCVDWIKTRKASSIDKILTILATFRIGLIWVTLVYWFGAQYHSPLLITETPLRIIVSAWIFTNHFSLWFATILSIFYLFKIGNFSSPSFLYLKWRIKKVILMIQLATLIFLFLNLIQMNIHITDWIHQDEGNATLDSRISGFSKFSYLALFTLTMYSLIPFTVALISFCFLLFSQWKHLQKMKSNSKEHRDPRTKAHISAIKSVLSFLLLYASFLLCLIIASIPSIYQNHLAYSVLQSIKMIYLSSHSFILILGNPKLRQACVLMLWQLRCRLQR
ncbi:taste receptor type 2 member 13 [Oryctolagus cuniculus]|uniref:taste receptor type 2 member 13 n=1 Tax=Oryctolagus cuniculus TaxID=9986 RepID=UPI0001CE1455|nr:taste receptor type 2 member 13 [Oryctolagus cuniculus]